MGSIQGRLPGGGDELVKDPHRGEQEGEVRQWGQRHGQKPGGDLWMESSGRRCPTHPDSPGLWEHYLQGSGENGAGDGGW